jgi:hypothetical protein
MRIGIEIVDETRRPRPSAVAGMARAAEGLGYGAVWVRHRPTDDGAAIETADLLAIAAGATERVALGVSVPSPPLGALVDELAARREVFGDRLRVALPPVSLSPGDGVMEPTVVRLASLAAVLVDPSFDEVAARAVARGFFVVDPARVDEVGPTTLEEVVRVEVADRCADARRVLLELSGHGVDELVLAAAGEPDVDEAMATYAALAESLERAG